MRGFVRFLSVLLALLPPCVLSAADLPVREVILYKHGVGYFQRSGELKPGETARLEFKADDMDDVLKSLTITDRAGGKIDGIRYDASEPLEKRLRAFPFSTTGNTSMAGFLDSLKGARIELRFGPEIIAGTIVSARLAVGSEKSPEHETVTLLTDGGEIRTLDLGSAGWVKFSDAKLQGLLKDYLAVLNGARSKDRRSVYIDSSAAAARQLAVRYMTPAAVWKSSYRLILGAQGEPILEGWAIVDNTSGDDWNGVQLSVVSGRPISFISKLYEPRYVERQQADLAENAPVAPRVFGGAMGGVPQQRAMAMAAAPPASKAMAAELAPSTVSQATETREIGDLFEYSFSSPVTVKQGESTMLPFVQQKVNARKLLIYTENMGVNPMNAAELINSTGKTLDGGPITVYDAGAYAGEALVETFKAADKRLISYGIDLGTRVSTAWDSSREDVREIHSKRGMLTTRAAVEETRTYTIRNVDAKEKTLIIEHAQRQGYRLVNQKPAETTANAYRFEVKLPASVATTFAVKEERAYDQTTAITSATPDVIVVWLQNKTLSEVGRRQLEQIAQTKRAIADQDAVLRNTQAELTSLAQDQERTRQNIQSLNGVAGQQDLVQQYARQLASAEARLAALRDSQGASRSRKATLEAELNGLIERADF